MATKQTLASLLGSSDKRQQVELGLGQQALQPGARAGNYQVAVQQTLGASQTTAGKLANALQGVSPVLRQYTDFTYQQGVNTAAAVLPQDAEAELKKMEPDTWLNMARQRGLREGLIKKQLNENVIPGIKRDIQQFLDYKKYPSPQKAEEAFDNYNADKWAEYSASLPEGIGDSLEAKVMWSSLMSTTKNGLIESYNSGLDKFNMSTNRNEDQQLWNVETAKDTTGDGVDWRGSIDRSVNTAYTLNEKSGIPKAEITKDVRTTHVARADTLVNQGRFDEAQEYIKQLRFYKRNGQNIFRDTDTEKLLSSIENRARNGATALSNKDNADDIKLLGDKGLRFLIETNSNAMSVVDNSRMVAYIQNFTTASAEDIQAELNARVENGETNGGAFMNTFSHFAQTQSTDEQDALYSQVFTDLKGAEVRVATQALQTIGDAAVPTQAGRYEQQLESGTTTLSPAAWAKLNGFTLTPAQIQESFQPIFNSNQDFLSIKNIEKTNQDNFVQELRAIGGDVSGPMARTYANNLETDVLKPLYTRLGELRGKEQLTKEEEAELNAIPQEIKAARAKAIGNFSEYIELYDERRNITAAQMDKAIEKVAAAKTPNEAARVRVGGKSFTAKTVLSKTARARVSVVGVAGKGVAVETGIQREWTEEEIRADRQVLKNAGPQGKPGLTYSLAAYPVNLSFSTEEDVKRTIELVDMLQYTDVDIYEDGVYLFETGNDASEFIYEASNIYKDFRSGQMDQTPRNQALLTFAQHNGLVDKESVRAALQLTKSKYSKKPE